MISSSLEILSSSTRARLVCTLLKLRSFNLEERLYDLETTQKATEDDLHRFAQVVGTVGEASLLEEHIRRGEKRIRKAQEDLLEGKVALITGGAAGIGKSIARLFSIHGAKICIADVCDEPGRILCESLGGDHIASFLHCDVTVEDDIRRAVDFTAEKYGTIDIMVNNAGITGPKVVDIRDVALEDFKWVFDVNVNGVFLGMKHAGRVMIPRGRGSIISLASVSSIVGGFGPHGYTASKHAVAGLTKSVAAELGKHGIRVNCVSPYAIPTNLAMAHLPEDQRTDENAVKDFLSFVGSHANLKGVDMMPEDAAYAVLYLASDESRYVSGLNLTVDGGVTGVNTSLRQFE